ncbi:MAG TPA: YfhO family protein [Chloroflexota bacterium]|nr:YfhO family protein [Chloroflexota bacterium]HUM68091.1 YfhO family protein [Chloroflexota bacterium]
MGDLKQLLRRVDPGFFVVVAIALIAIWPFVSRASLPVETDAELHIFRLHELGLLVRGGDYYPRWAPNFYHGYGYPIFNYYAPLAYYVGLLFELWPFWDAVAAVKAGFIIGLLAAALGMYGFVRDNWGRPAGYVAAAIYVYAPYVQYVDPHARGVLPESLSLGIFPLALWALDRLRKGGGARVWVTAVLLTAAVILSHNLMGLLFFALLCAWAVWQIVCSRLTHHASRVTPHASRITFAALLLGLGVAAFFWLPVLLERNAVTLQTLIGQGGNYDFHTHFLSLQEMLALSQQLDWGASEPAFRFNLGVMQWVMAALAVVLLFLRRLRQGAHVVFFALALVGLLFLMLPAATPVWEGLSFMAFFQFPWRLLGAAAAMCAVLAGAATDGLLAAWQGHKRVEEWLTAVLVSLTIALGLLMSQPALWDDFGEVNTLRMSLIENTGRWLGTTSTADYVPATVDVVPARKASVVSGIVEGLPMDRVNWDVLPPEVMLETQVIRPLHTRYIMDTPQKLLFRLYLFDFPGWEVRIDGEPVLTELGRPEGFLVVPVPAGRHVIDVEFGSTPTRTAAHVVTAVSLALMLLVAWGLRRRQVADNSQLPPLFPPRLERPDWVTLVVVLGVTAVTILLLEPTGVLHYNSSGLEAEPAATDMMANFGEQIALIGYTARRPTAVPGDMIPLELYWKALNPLDINFQVFVHLLSPDGVLVAQSDKLNPGEFPTRRWSLDTYVRDEHYLALPPDLPPGEYRVSAGLWVQSEGWRLPLLVDGVQVGDNVELFTLVVR